MALKMLLVKVGLTDIGLVLGVTEETVLRWLERAAHKAHEMNAHLLRKLPVTEVQLDEMWSFIKREHAQQAEADGESSDLSEDGRSGCGSVLLRSIVSSWRRLLAHERLPVPCSSCR